MTRTEHTICRACHAQCGLLVEIDDGKPGKIVGDKNNPVYHGYSCIKGRELGSYHSLASRLLTSMKRGPDGDYTPIASDKAIDEIATRVDTLVREHGPRSVAAYIGTHGFNNFPATAFTQAFLDAIGSPMLFTSVTIDQPGKAISTALLGPWLAGLPTVDECDTLMLVGSNPIVSMNGGLGPNPARRLHQMKKRGLRLIVIDPRETDVARHADIHLQGRPGEDPAIMAAMIRVILAEALYDKDFVARETVNLDRLAAAVDPFTPEVAAARAHVPADQIVEAARLFATGTRGGLNCGTGPNMSGHGNLTEYLGKVLLTLGGYWLRAGDQIANPGVLIERPPAIAGTPGPLPAWGFGEKMRVKNLTDTLAGLPTAALADEILLDGTGQVKALFVVGGNPMLAWPDQLKAFEAMKSLELLVCIDPQMSATGRLAHYVIAPKLPFEFSSTTALMEMLASVGSGWGYPKPYAQYTPALIDPPAGSDVMEEWEFFFGLCQRMGRRMSVAPLSILDKEKAAEMATPLDMSRKPTADEVWEMVLKGSPVPFAEVREKARQGHVFERPPLRVAPRPDDWQGRLDLGNDVMMAELDEIAASRPATDGFDFRLISRRLNDVLNSCWHDHEPLLRRWRYNPAFMNPDDMARWELAPGDVIEIESARAAILGVVEAAPDVKAGCISMPHAWGRNPGEEGDPLDGGSNTGRLTSTDQDFDP
ncbi:MAG: molybdopterin dinucleotide-binding protein, partial [Alphaproteobacteria bacterium]